MELGFKRGLGVSVKDLENGWSYRGGDWNY